MPNISKITKSGSDVEQVVIKLMNKGFTNLQDLSDAVLSQTGNRVSLMCLCRYMKSHNIKRSVIEPKPMSYIPRELLSKLSLLTYGTTLVGAYLKFLKLTNTKKSDMKNGRTDAQSFNQGPTSIIQAIHYIPTVRQNTLNYHTHNKKGQFFSSAQFKEHVMQVPCILVWIWDNRFTNLLKECKLCSLIVSKHYADDKHIPLDIDWSRYSPSDNEVILKSKDLRPEPDYLILGSDSKLSGLSPSIIKKIFFPEHEHMRIIVSSSRLMTNNITDYERYISNNKDLEYEIRLNILNDLMKRNDLGPDMIGVIETIKKFMNQQQKLKEDKIDKVRM